MNNNNEINIGRMGIAYWLAKNTKLTSSEITCLCRKVGLNIHDYFVTLLRREEGNEEIAHIDPIELKIFTEEQITLNSHQDLCKRFNAKSGKRYIPLALRAHIPSAIKWIKSNYPHVKDIDLGKAFGKGTESIKKLQFETIESINPVSVNLLTAASLSELIKK